ncbi:enoyl-CoA hydratase-related protein [Cryptosporangium minutisporangium]|uniref:Enoyl-CoA hydratase-related protein n=1 Tax=Cryptosporangium minutisporangium TaxID=113569 RepID=A0ABP6SZG2_9ACTN
MENTSTGFAVSRDGGVLRIDLDRSARKNALDAATVCRLIEVFTAAATDDDLRVVVLGSRGPDFCSGADWVRTNRGDQPRPRTGAVQRRTAVEAHRLVQLITEVQLPVVCAVRGYAAGLGCQLALAADFTVAAEDSCFWEPFVQRGFSADGGATWLLPRLAGVARAKDMLLLGRKVTGAEAAAWGMIHRAVPAADVESAAADVVERLAVGPTVAVGLTKRAIHRGLSLGLGDAMEYEATALELSSRTTDFKEGLAAFTQRRPPRFTGR